jgi:hypothetical protein
MKIVLEKISINSEIFMRDCGYRVIENPHQGGEKSFTRSLNWGHFYPRFHVYLNQLPDVLEINLHLDMKKPSYEGTTAHSGEYDGRLVEEEARRIKSMAEKLILTEHSASMPKVEKKKSFWDKILGEDEE